MRIFIKEDPLTSNVVWAQSSHLKLTRAELNYFKPPFSYQNYQKVHIPRSPPTYLRVATKSISCCDNNEFALFLIHEIFDRESLLYYISITWFYETRAPYSTCHVLTCHTPCVIPHVLVLIREWGMWIQNILGFLYVNI